MQANGTDRPNSPGNMIMAAPTSNRMDGAIVGTAGKWKTSAASDRPYTPNHTMTIGQTGVVKWTTSSRGEPLGTATNETVRAGTDCLTSHEMKCMIEQRASTLTETGAPQSAAGQGTCTAGNRKTDTAGKDTRVKPAEMPTTPPTPTTPYRAAGRTVESFSHVQFLLSQAREETKSGEAQMETKPGREMTGNPTSFL